MSGNTENARLWADADVYVADTLNAANPTGVGAVFPAAWQIVGLLDGEEGFVQSRDEETSDHYAWGGILVRTSRRNFKLQQKFTVLEDNPTTRELIWPGSPAGQIIVPRPRPVKIAFETRDGLTVKRLITRRYAEVTVDGDITDNESDLSKVSLIATIYPDANGVLFDEQNDETTGS